MPSGTKEKLLAWRQSHQHAVIDPKTLEQLALEFGVTAATLRKHARSLDLPMTPLAEGVRQDSIDHAERTLTALSQAYRQGSRAATRETVLTARTHAEWAMRKNPTPERDEMLLWIRTWLENPEIFPEWVKLRRR